MTILGRRRSSPSKDQKTRRQEFQRRVLWGESLEPRAMMDGSGFTLTRYPFWNINQPKDVNADGLVTAMDALRIINDLNLNGARSLASSSPTNGGEGPSSNPNFIDVNNDNRVSAMDALQVINQLNRSAGEGEPLMRMEVQIVAAGTNNPITTINKGGFYEMRILATDLGMLTYMGQTRPATQQVTGETLLAVATTFFDVEFDTTKTDVQTNDGQRIVIGGTPTTNGTFTLTVNDGGTLRTTAAITFAANRGTTATNIKNALNTLLKSTPTSPDVVEVTNETSGGVNRWGVRFINRLGSQDLPEMTGTVNGSLGAATITITETISGETSNAVAYADALAPRTRFDADGNPLNEEPPYFDQQRGGSRLDTPTQKGINDLGGSHFQSPYSGANNPVEIARIHMDAKDAGLVTFDLNYLNVALGLETGMIGFNNPVTSDLIEVIDDTLNITEPLSAGDDSINTTEGATAPIDISVLTNDINNPPTPSTTKTIQSLNTTGLLGSAQIKAGSGNTIITYTPPGGDINGVTTFTYTVTDQSGNTDTATVTVNIAAVNDAPVVNGPASQLINEDTPRIFNGVNGNAITLNDADNPTGSMTLTLSVGAGNGTLTLGSTANLTGTTGNNSSSITTNGTLSDLNTALSGLSFTPASNASGTVNLVITLNDNGQTPAPALQGSRTIPLTLTAVNDAPTVVLTGFVGIPNVVEGDSLVLNSATNTLIQVADVDAGSNPVIVTLHVTAGNILHVNTTSGVTIDTNDTNNVTLTGSIANINTALNGITYTPSGTFGGNVEQLDITINDQGNSGALLNPLSGTAFVNIDVDASTRPRARNDVKTVTEDSTSPATNTIDVLANDLVNLADPTVYFAELVSFQTTSVNNGTITRDDNGTPGNLQDDKLVYAPAANFFGTDSFTYSMNDTKAGSVAATGTVTVTVTAMNDAPVAQNDTITSVAEDSAARTILASDLTGNDSRGAANESAQTLTIASVGSAVGGTVSINGSGNVVFTPATNFNGAASFTYTVQDNGQTNGVNDFKTSNAATVSFTITEVNDAPTAPATITIANIAEDSGTYVIPVSTLLASVSPGPSNENGQTLTLTQVSAPNGGTVNIVGSNVEFTPTANFNAAVGTRFNITVTDNGTTNGVAAPLTVSSAVQFAITPVNDAPVAANDTALTGESQPVDIAVRTNDSDVDVSPFTGTPGQLEAGTTIVNITTPVDASLTPVGTAVVQGTGIRFTPNTGFFGTATFTYQLNDGSGGATALSAPATVTVTVQEANDPPVANPDPGIFVNEDATVAIDVFANDTDPDTAKIGWSFILITGPAHGTAVFNTATRVVDYTPAANYNGPDSFVYQINDNSPVNPPNSHLSGTALVSITVREVNDSPVGGTDPATGQFTVIKDRDRTFTTTELLANDSPGSPANESGQTISITGVTANPLNGGTVTLNGGTILYTPAVGFTGIDSFTYTLTDNGTTAGNPDPKSVPVTVNIIVRDFLPTDVNGFVFRDVNNNGTYQVGIDYPLSGVTVTLSGASDVTGAITPTPTTTNHLGFYQFLAVEPGTYHLVESQPVGLADGPESLGLAAAFSANDDLVLTLPLLGVAGGVSTNNFAEGGIDANKLVNSSGLVNELLASSSNNGYVLATTLGGVGVWNWRLQGWTNATSIQITLDSDKTAATMVVNGFTTRIFQNPNDPRNANRLNADPVARLARFRILGWDAAGNYMIRLDGSASDFYGSAHPLAAVAPPLSAGEYEDGVDAAMSEESWA